MHTPTLPAVLISQYYAQLEDLNYAISCRERGQRFPNEKEVEIIRKLSICIKNLQSGLPKEAKAKKEKNVENQSVVNSTETEISENTTEEPIPVVKAITPEPAQNHLVRNKYLGIPCTYEEERMPPVSLLI